MDWYSFCSIAPNNHLLSLGEISREVDTPRVLLTFSFPPLLTRFALFTLSCGLLAFSVSRSIQHSSAGRCRPSQRFLRPADSSYRRRPLVAERQRWWRRRHERQRHIHVAEDSSFARRSVFSWLNGVYLFPLFWSCSAVRRVQSCLRGCIPSSCSCPGVPPSSSSRFCVRWSSSRL